MTNTEMARARETLQYLYSLAADAEKYRDSWVGKSIDGRVLDDLKARVDSLSLTLDRYPFEKFSNLAQSYGKQYLNELGSSDEGILSRFGNEVVKKSAIETATFVKENVPGKGWITVWLLLVVVGLALALVLWLKIKPV